uniref:Uncharacterized protein n=1 Tax=viral metagenome TaxID=1070528 RepID=A0A6C0DJ33_9ZZZZ
MIIIIDVYGGLCNQFYDIITSVNFCIINNFKFTFRFCSFREDNLTSWHNERFEKLFDIKFLEKIENSKHLFVEYDSLNINEQNTNNYHGDPGLNLYSHNFLNEIQNINREFIVLKQFWWGYIKNNGQIVHDLHKDILPSQRLMNVYNAIKTNLNLTNEEYNFIHYRYESDFINHFKINDMKDLKTIILLLKPKFKNPNLKIYIAASNIKNLINLDDEQMRDIIITKDEDSLKEFNFEENAFIDYMIGLYSKEVFGHSKSAFSHMLNSLKNTPSNFYDLL